MLDPDIAAYYEMGLEDSRLFVAGAPRLEYLRTLELLSRVLPSAPSRVLDVGGGTGVYAVPLCESGYEVHVVDPVPKHVEAVRERAHVERITGLTAELGDARDLSHADEAFGAVLLLGPLYHLTEKGDRERAFTEAARVLRPGGVVAAVAISRYASLLDGLKRKILDDPAFRSVVESDLRDGQHRNPDVVGRPEIFTTAYFHLPGELQEEAVAAGFTDTQLFAVEGPSWIVEDGEHIESQLFAARAVEREPALMAATSHFMVVGRTAGRT